MKQAVRKSMGKVGVYTQRIITCVRKIHKNNSHKFSFKYKLYIPKRLDLPCLYLSDARM